MDAQAENADRDPSEPRRAWSYRRCLIDSPADRLISGLAILTLAGGAFLTASYGPFLPGICAAGAAFLLFCVLWGPTLLSVGRSGTCLWCSSRPGIPIPLDGIVQLRTKRDPVASPPSNAETIAVVGAVSLLSGTIPLGLGFYSRTGLTGLWAVLSDGQSVCLARFEDKAEADRVKDEIGRLIAEAKPLPPPLTPPRMDRNDLGGPYERGRGLA